MISAYRDFAQEAANFEFAIATANRLKPRFVIVTGDLVNKPGDAAQTAEYLRISQLHITWTVYRIPAASANSRQHGVSLCTG